MRGGAKQSSTLMLLGLAACVAHAKPPCPAGQQHVAYGDGSLCVSNAFEEFLACLEMARLSSVALEAEAAVGGAGGGGKEEGVAVGSVRTKHGSGPLAEAVSSCARRFAGGPSPESRLAWQRNWDAVRTEFKSVSDQATGYQFTNRATFVNLLKALDLSSDAFVARKRDALLQRVNQTAGATTRGPDAARNVETDLVWDADLRWQYGELRRAVELRARYEGVDVERVPPKAP